MCTEITYQGQERPPGAGLLSCLSCATERGAVWRAGHALLERRSLAELGKWTTPRRLNVSRDFVTTSRCKVGRPHMGFLSLESSRIIFTIMYVP